MNLVCYVMILWANYFLYEMKLIKKKNININFFNCNWDKTYFSDVLNAIKVLI